jgi:hypothetical protein
VRTKVKPFQRQSIVETPSVCLNQESEPLIGSKQSTGSMLKLTYTKGSGNSSHSMNNWALLRPQTVSNTSPQAQRGLGGRQKLPYSAGESQVRM